MTDSRLRPKSRDQKFREFIHPKNFFSSEDLPDLDGIRNFIGDTDPRTSFEASPTEATSVDTGRQNREKELEKAWVDAVYRAHVCKNASTVIAFGGAVTAISINVLWKDIEGMGLLWPVAVILLLLLLLAIAAKLSSLAAEWEAWVKALESNIKKPKTEGESGSTERDTELSAHHSLQYRYYFPVISPCAHMRSTSKLTRLVSRLYKKPLQASSWPRRAR